MSSERKKMARPIMMPHPPHPPQTELGYHRKYQLPQFEEEKDAPQSITSRKGSLQQNYLYLNYVNKIYKLNLSRCHPQSQCVVARKTLKTFKSQITDVRNPSFHKQPQVLPQENGPKSARSHNFIEYLIKQNDELKEENKHLLQKLLSNLPSPQFKLETKEIQNNIESPQFKPLKKDLVAPTQLKQTRSQSFILPSAGPQKSQSQQRKEIPGVMQTGQNKYNNFQNIQQQKSTNEQQNFGEDKIIPEFKEKIKRNLQFTFNKIQPRQSQPQKQINKLPIEFSKLLCKKKFVV